MALLVRTRWTIRLTLIALVAAMGRSSAEGPAAGEHQVKAAFLLNFAKFVEWPQQAFSSAGEPIGICVLGANPFGAALDDVVRGKTVANRTFALRQIASAKEATGCHIIFIAASERKRSRAMLAELSGKSILTVGEAEDFIGEGGVVRFKLKDDRVRFEIDVDGAARANLRISSKLMSLAENTRR